MRITKSKRQSTDGNEKCATFRISQFIESSHHRMSSGRLPFADKKNKMSMVSSKSILKLSTKKTMPHSNRNIRQASGNLQALSRLVKLNSSQYADMITRQIDFARRRNLVKDHNQAQILTSIFQLSQLMHQEVYAYRQIEVNIKELHLLIKKLGSATFTYRAFAFAGLVLFQYGSFSLSLYYFDRALKSFYDRDNAGCFDFQKKLELQIYKFVTRIFLVKGRNVEAKNFAYKLLRKAWILGNIDQEMGAYDLLGKIYMQLQSMTMCRYFHWRMRSSKRENPEILAMSRQQMENQTTEKMEFVCYETINIFVDKDMHFNDILENHYRVRSLEHAKEAGIEDSQSRMVFAYTHHSPNRELKNYHLLERKMIEAKDSKELHFIRPKDSYRLKKLFSDFSALIHELIQKINSSHYPTQFSIAEESPSELQSIQ